MSTIKISDFYYGAVLSMLFSHNIKPALIETGTDRQVYDFTTNNSEFKKSGSDKLYIKTYNAGLETLNNLYLRSFSQWSSNSVQMTFFFFSSSTSSICFTE